MSGPVLSLAAIGELVEQVVRARPETLGAVVSGYRDLSERAAGVTGRAEGVDRATAEMFLSGGREVFDAAAATAGTRARLGAGGEHYRLVSDAVAVVAEQLTETRDGANRAWGELNLEIRAIRGAEDALARSAPTMTQADVDARAAVLRDRYTSALQQHGGTIFRLVEEYRTVLISRSRVLSEIAVEPAALPAGSAPATPPPGGTAEEVNTWWRGLSPQQQADLIATDPGLVGNLDGVPVEARDQANRQVLASEIVRYEGLRRDAQGRADGYDTVPEWLDVLPPLARVQRAEDDLAASTARLDGLRAIQARLDDPGARPASLIGLQPDIGNGRAIVAVGDPDTADNVVTYVPGTTARLDTLAGDVARADITAEAARQADPTEQTAVITWLGYDAPQSILPEAGYGSFADAAEPALRDFQDGLRATHDGAPSHNTVLGHSYGSTVIGQTARDHALDADALVFAGSPGVGVGHVEEFRRPPGTVYSTTAESDPILVTHSPLLGAATDAHGADPSDPHFGAEVFRSDPESGHTDYWNEGNPSLDNFGLIAVGEEPIR